MNLVAVYNRQPAIRSSGLLRSALVTAQRSGDGKPDRFLARTFPKSSAATTDITACQSFPWPSDLRGSKHTVAG